LAQDIASPVHWLPSASPCRHMAQRKSRRAQHKDQKKVRSREQMGPELSLSPVTTSATVIEQHACLKTVRLLRQGMSLEALQARYKLIVKKHPHFDIVQLSYSQTESPMGSPVVQECRGLILEMASWNVISLPFTKFFNYGESNAKGLDWSDSVRVHEKLDGSIHTLYWYQGCWNVASNKLPAADGPVPDGSTKTFADVFWEVWSKKCYKLPVQQDACFMFELLLPSHTIVVRHQETDLVCLGGRDMKTLTEFSCEDAGQAHGWDTPKRFDDLCNLDSVLSAARLLNPVAQEGFVVVDQHWNRLKIKSAGYVALHHLSGNACLRQADATKLSNADRKTLRRSLLQIARNNEGDEFLAYFPELDQEFCEACAALRALGRYLEHCVSSGFRSPCVPGLERLFRKLRRGEYADQLLRDMKIQVLEAALELMPADTVAELSRSPKNAAVASECGLDEAQSHRLDSEEGEHMVQTCLQSQGDADSECDADTGGESQVVTPQKVPNRFAAFDSDSSSDSESEG